ncbi:hypothetical protein MMC11_007239 [Xylographa trunciseda]|nr:hypothetical protein [Xylographa trunciseda]
MTPNPNVVWVPMKLDAYLNYDPRRTVGTDPRSRAYLAPINTPNLDGLQLDSNLLQHDIFEQHRNAPYMGCADPCRQSARRLGIYLHWSLPRMYRVGVTGSSGPDSVTATSDARKYGGYPAAAQVYSGRAIGTPVFRPTPERWIVMRIIRPAVAGPYTGKVMMRVGRTEGQASLNMFNQTTGGDFAIRDFFVVQSDSVRDISTIPATEDVEVTSSPFITDSLSPSQQGQTFLGQASPYTTWTGNDNNPNPNPTTVTVSRAGNPYFPDYQPQNSSVFSFFDDLIITGPTGINAYYTQGDISYTVLGYHTLAKNDPLNVDVNFVKDQTFADRLARCSLSLQNQLDAKKLNSDDTTWLDVQAGGSPMNMRTLNHGSLYGLPWSESPSEGPVVPNFKYPGDDVQQLFAKTHPVAVGTNPIDALFGWLRSTNDIGGLTTDQIRGDLLKVSTLILDVNDDVDSQLMAQDLLSTDNFVPRSSGTVWHFQAQEGLPDDTQPVVPSDAQAKGLRNLNAIQVQLNSILREQDRLKGELFAAWWTYVADKGNPNIDSAQLKQRISFVVSALKIKIRANVDDTNNGVGLIKTLSDRINAKKGSLGLVQAGIEPNFHTQRDPTLFIAGLSSKWPTDWDQDLNIRLNPQNYPMTMPYGIQWPPLDSSYLGGKAPTALSKTMADALSEGLLGGRGIQAFQSTSTYWNNGDQILQKPSNTYSNGWFPLFIEWEVEYYHIPFDNWEFGPQGPEARVGYSLTDNANPADPNIQSDYRILNGRCPILPQTGAILETRLKQVFSKTNPATLALSLDDKVALLSGAKSLDFASTPMSGLTDQLLTRMQGMHVLPLIWTSDGKLAVTADAAPSGAEIGLNSDSNGTDFLLMAGQTSKTPFASLVDIPTDTSKFNPFKPCIHGQFRFTKLNIIDKFGQIVQGIQTYSDLTRSVGPTATPLFPCLGDSYSVDQKSDKTAKIVLPRTDQNCNFVQLPPSINQDARVNAMFLKEDAPPQWRPLDEWENPVRGWLIINQANVSLQVFTPDGRFVREFGVANQNPITRPFTADSTLSNSLDPVLKAFLARFSDNGYLAGIFRSITQTTDAIQANPSSYSESMLSVLGRPLALTVFGVNLELADPAKVNQSTVGSNQVQPAALTDYSFGLKIGDKDNIFDGLFGYFMAAPDVSKGVEINWSQFYTYHEPDPTEVQITGDPSRKMPTDTTISPFYPDPHAADFAQERMQKIRVFAAIVDPFTAVNCYTALLPVRQMKLPQWTIHTGLNEISAFFKMGPFLVPSDVPAFDTTKIVAKDYKLDDPNAPQPNGTLPIPSVGMGDWAWLQPYANRAGGTSYNVMDVASPSSKPQFEDAPYTVIEGFLQQKKPFTAPETLPT